VAVVIVLPIALLLALLFYAIGVGSLARWYEQAKLEDAESGRLAESLERNRDKPTET
jgi:hypothetical protein